MIMLSKDFVGLEIRKENREKRRIVRRDMSILDAADVRHIKELLSTLGKLNRASEDINLWSLLDDFKETSFSRLLAFLLDSTREHGLGNSFFRAWTKAIQKKYKICLTRRSLYHTKAYVEWPADNHRRLDVLIKGYSPNGKEFLFVIGIENKINAEESKAQLSDYQAALEKQFPRVPTVALFFLTPNGRAGWTCDRTSKCKCFDVSYSTVSDACAAAKTQNRATTILVKHLAAFIDGSMLGGNVHKSRQLKQLISSKPAYLEAAKHIRRYGNSTTIRNVMYEKVLPRLRDTLGETHISWHWPQETSRPKEFNFLSQTTKTIKIEERRHTIYYMLYSDSDEPDVGDVFTVHVVMQSDEAVSTKVKTAAKLYRDRLEWTPALRQRKIGTVAVGC
jgi:hypothetical protein